MLKESFASISKKMCIDFGEISNKIEHMGERGNARESILVDYLRKYLPERYEISKGIIADSSDIQSRQVDLIIHDRYMTPYLLQYDSTKVIPVETVYCTIEVKSVIDKNQLTKGIENVASVRKLKKQQYRGMIVPTAGMIFAYDSSVSMDTLFKSVVDISERYPIEERPCCLCVLNKGLIVCVSKDNISQITLFPSDRTCYALLKNTEDALLIFYIILMQILTNIIAFPPNMLEYAQAAGKIDMTLNILKGYIPDDANLVVGDKKIEYVKVKSLFEYGRHMLCGETTKKDFCSEFLEIYGSILQMVYGDLKNVTSQNVSFDYFGVQVKALELIRAYRIWKSTFKSDEDDQFLEDFIRPLYELYDLHREEMMISSRQKV